MMSHLSAQLVPDRAQLCAPYEVVAEAQRTNHHRKLTRAENVLQNA